MRALIVGLIVLCSLAAGEKPGKPGAAPKPAAAPRATVEPEEEVEEQVEDAGPGSKPDLRSLSRRAMSKLAPLKQMLTGEPAFDADADAEAGDEDGEDLAASAEEGQPPAKKTNWLFMAGALVARLALTMLMLFIQKRRAAGGAAGEAGGSLLETLSAGPLGPLIAAAQRGWAQLVAFSHSHYAPPVMMGLMIIGMKWVQRIDAAREAELEVEAEVQGQEEVEDEAEAEADMIEVEAEDEGDADGGEPLEASAGSSDGDGSPGEGDDDEDEDMYGEES